MLEALGIALPPPLWSAAAIDTHPDVIASLHAAYAAAGATVHTANTFRTSPTAAGDDAVRLTSAAVALCRGAVPRGHRVAGSLAPVFDCWRPDLSPSDALARHRLTARLLAGAGVDLILVETFAHPDEAVAATRAAVETGLEVWSSLTPGFDGALLAPPALAQASRRCVEAGASRALVNCLPAAHAEPWVEALAATGVPWGVQANGGAPEDGLTHGTPGSADRYAAIAAGWRAQGASVIGGCCGTGPEHIRALCNMFHSPVHRP